MFCLDEIMLIFEIPKLFHFQRAALQTQICLPFLPFQPSRLDWHRLGADQEAETPCLCQPGLPTQLLARHEEVPPPRPLECPPEVVTLPWKGTSGYFHFPSFPRGRAHAALSMQSEDAALEMHHFLTGRRKVEVQRESPVLLWVSVTCLGLEFIAAWPVRLRLISIITECLGLGGTRKFFPFQPPAMGFIRRISKDNPKTFINIFASR